MREIKRFQMFAPVNKQNDLQKSSWQVRVQRTTLNGNQISFQTEALTAELAATEMNNAKSFHHKLW